MVDVSTMTHSTFVEEVAWQTPTTTAFVTTKKLVARRLAAPEHSGMSPRDCASLSSCNV